MAKHPYWLDANVYIQSKNGPYGLDFAPRFWGWIEDCSNKGLVKSPMMVCHELLDGNDELAEWAREMKDNGLFVDAAEDVQQHLSKMADHVQKEYSAAKCIKFLDGADLWIVAHAAANKGVVVTHEKRLDVQCKTPKIPNICDNFGIKCINLYDLGLRFD